MIESLVRWAVGNRLVVCLLILALIAVGGYSALHINVEAYPDPAPAIVEVIAQNPGASAEEIERQVTIPLEVALAGMPGLESTRSKSLFGLSHLRNQFDYATDPRDARIEVINRLNLAQLPDGVTPAIAPTSPTGEIYRYYLRSPVDQRGTPIYEMRDLKSIQDWTLQREFRRVPRIADTVSFGGAVKRYEVQPDPDRLRRFGVALDQLEEAIASSNANAGGDYLLNPHSVQVVRGLGLLGRGTDPMLSILREKDPRRAAEALRRAERDRIREIRQIVLAATNNVPVRVGDVVDGGRASETEEVPDAGVVATEKPPSGRAGLGKPRLDASGSPVLDKRGAVVWEDIPDVVQGIVLLRKGEQSLPALDDVHKKVEELNTPGRLPPGIRIETFYDRTGLIHKTTETVHENLLVGILLVTGVLLLFLNHVPSALIVALNIPLALLVAFTVLYLRGKSANLLSLGAVDFGIIVDSTVIMVECIFRRLSSGRDAQLPLEERITSAAAEVQRSLFYSTLIMVCALLPLFTMAGPEGRIFGPMADAYALALGGALLLALTASPTLCRIFLAKVKATRDNFVVRAIKWFYFGQLNWMLQHRWMVVAGFVALVLATGASLPFLGREFMPALEEGNIYVRGTFPPNVSLDEVSEKSLVARRLLEKYPEVASVLSQVGRPDDGTDPTGFYNSELLVPLRDDSTWPLVVERIGWARKLFGPKRRRTKAELVELMDSELERSVVGVDWNFSQAIRDNVMETLSGVKGENCLKIFGPDLGELESLAARSSAILSSISGIRDVGVFSVMGQTNLELPIDRDKCARWNVSVGDVQDALATAVGGRAFTEMVEGERTFDIALRWPRELRSDEEAILDIPVDVLKNRVIPMTESDGGINLAGTVARQPVATGSINEPLPSMVARRRLRDLVTPLAGNEAGADISFTRDGASTIYREQGQRLIAVKFSVRGRDLASAVAEARERTGHLFSPPYTVEWAGEFEEMEHAVVRLGIVAALALALIVVILYLALGSLLDVAVVLVNVVVICIGGIAALFATGENFNISAGVGFISVLGVGMMDGLILVSGFNGERAHGVPLMPAIKDVMDRYIRPLTMTPLLAIFGLLPAALSTRIGSESQRPLAIVVVGGMTMTLILRNLVPVLYSYYGSRTPPQGVGGMGH